MRDCSGGYRGAREGRRSLVEIVLQLQAMVHYRSCDLEDRWRELIDRLVNRVSADDRKKALAAIHARIPKPAEAEAHALRIEAMRDSVETWERLGASSSACIESNRKLICERSIAEKQASVDLAAQKAHRARMFTLELARGERLEGDDDLVLDDVAGAANKHAARIRAKPRPAARGRRGRQNGRARLEA